MYETGNFKLFMDRKKKKAEKWFQEIRDVICRTFEEIEDDGDARLGAAGRFQCKSWARVGGGGGEISLMRGRVFEKVGVNISTVYGVLSDDFKKQIEGAEGDGRFWASGVSLVAHLRNPHVPAAHMNTRFIVTKKSWFGGGGDLTPLLPDDGSGSVFHQAMKSVCDKHDPNYYQEFKKWCDDYFFLPHRSEPRGAGGIFFDNLNSGDWDNDFKFVQDLGLGFKDVYGEIVRKRMNRTWTDDERREQLIRRGRYVEFNLLYDRGTLFGLKTGGNVDAIFMSLPPEVRWP